MAKEIETKKESKYMKKTVITIGKGLLKVALFLIGFCAFCGVTGEPTEAWYNWADKMFGVFSGAWFVIERILWMIVIGVCCKVWEIIEPDAFKDNRQAKAGQKTAEE